MPTLWSIKRQGNKTVVMSSYYMRSSTDFQYEAWVWMETALRQQWHSLGLAVSLLHEGCASVVYMHVYVHQCCTCMYM